MDFIRKECKEHILRNRNMHNVATVRSSLPSLKQLRYIMRKQLKLACVRARTTHLNKNNNRDFLVYNLGVLAIFIKVIKI